MTFLRQLGYTLGIGMAALAIVLVNSWPSLSRIGVDAALHRYAKEVRKAHISLADKERLLDLIEEMQDKLTNEQMSLFDWVYHDQAIQEMLADGIVGDEVQQIERELKRAVKEFQEPQP